MTNRYNEEFKTKTRYIVFNVLYYSIFAPIYYIGYFVLNILIPILIYIFVGILILEAACKSELLPKIADSTGIKWRKEK